MRTVETSTGPVEVRSLTRKEIRDGKDHGLRYFGIEDMTDRFEDCRDYCLGCLLDEHRLDEITNPDQNLLFAALIKETWGDPGEEKNLPMSGLSDQTNDGKTSAPAA